MAKKVAPKADARTLEVCAICGVTAENTEVHTAWHESQQVRYTELVAAPEPQGGTVLFAPPVEEPEQAPLGSTESPAEPVPDEDQPVIHVPK